MHETEVQFEADAGARIAGTLCLPESASPGRPAAGIVLLGGTFGDTRDGDMAPERSPYAGSVPNSGLLRRIAHRLASSGIATLRFDKRGCGRSGGNARSADSDSDLRDAFAAVDALRVRPEIDAARIGVFGHSAGASQACAIARDRPEIACVGLLGMLFSSLEDLVRWNWGRVATVWGQLTDEQRQWLRENRPREVVGAFRTEEFIAAARAGEERVTLSAEGVSVELELLRFRQGMDRLHGTPRQEQYRGVRCPALVLHGGLDMNVRVEDALDSYQALRGIENERVTLLVIPGVDHNFQQAAPDPLQRAWERITFASQGHPVSPVALDAMGSWAAGVLGDADAATRPAPAAHTEER